MIWRRKICVLVKSFFKDFFIAKCTSSSIHVCNESVNKVFFYTQKKIKKTAKTA